MDIELTWFLRVVLAWHVLGCCFDLWRSWRAEPDAGSWAATGGMSAVIAIWAAFLLWGLQGTK